MADASLPLLSIVVPTRNRAQYAIPMIKSVLELGTTELELVIGDNSDDDSLNSWIIRHHPDPRLRYERISDPLSMTENHNRAFSRARGEYVCLIGDDDTVLPSAIAVSRWARDNHVDAVTPETPLRYCWPDLQSRYWGARQAGRLFMDPWRVRAWKGNPASEALACLARAGQGAGWLPKTYHGIIRRSCLEELRVATGAYCYGVSPDIYLALAVSSSVRRQVCTTMPLTIPGASGKSNSGRAALRRHKGDLRSDPHMARFASLDWPAMVPRFFSVETVWAQAALEATRRASLGNSFNFPRLYALCLLNHLDYRHEIIQSITEFSARSNRRSAWARVVQEGARELGRKSTYYSRRLTRPTPRGFSRELGIFADISDAKRFAVRECQSSLVWMDQTSWDELPRHLDGT